MSHVKSLNTKNEVILTVLRFEENVWTSVMNYEQCLLSEMGYLSPVNLILKFAKLTFNELPVLMKIPCPLYSPERLGS